MFCRGCRLIKSFGCWMTFLNKKTLQTEIGFVCEECSDRLVAGDEEFIAGFELVNFPVELKGGDL